MRDGAQATGLIKIKLIWPANLMWRNGLELDTAVSLQPQTLLMMRNMIPSDRLQQAPNCCFGVYLLPRSSRQVWMNRVNRLVSTLIPPSQPCMVLFSFSGESRRPMQGFSITPALQETVAM
jgi:hypothetical protein